MSWVTALAVCVPATVFAKTLLVADFNTGTKPNVIGGDFGAWDKDPQDPTQSCTIAFDDKHAFGGVGYALRVDYDVDSPNPAYNGIWMSLEGQDASVYKTLSFYIKGDASRGFTNQVKVELKSEKEVGSYLLKGVSSRWTKVSIPLKAFNLTDMSKMKEFVLVFDDQNSTTKAGSILIDEIAFEE
jgi:hypothetical protein